MFTPLFSLILLSFFICSGFTSTGSILAGFISTDFILSGIPVSLSTFLEVSSRKPVFLHSTFASAYSPSLHPLIEAVFQDDGSNQHTPSLLPRTISPFLTSSTQ